MEQESSYISTNLITRALSFYSILGYKSVSVPILVGKETSNFTKPKHKEDLFHNKSQDLVYIGSAEQSFLETYEGGEDPLMALTPCYRDEDMSFNKTTHFLLFLKLELFVPSTNCYNWDVFDVLNHSKEFFRSIGLDCSIQSTEETEGCSYDLICKEVELGSYGRRCLNNIDYIYGTGIAEPRASYTKNLEI